MRLPCASVNLVLLLLAVGLAGAACSDDSSGADGGAGGDISFPDVGGDAQDEEPAPFTCDDEDSLSPNHTPEEAEVVGPEGLEASDLFICPTFDDYYRIELEPGGGIYARIDFANRLGDLDLWLFDEDRIDAEDPVEVSGTQEDFEEIRFESEAGGRFILLVGGFEEATGLYDLAIQPTCGNDDDCPCGPSSDCDTLQYCVLRSRVCEPVRTPRCGDDAQEPNNEMSAPFVLGSFSFDGLDASAELGVTGAVCGDDVDYFRVTMDEITDLQVDLRFAPGDDLDLAVLDAAGQVVGASLGAQSFAEALDLPRLAAGTYLIYVDTTAGGSSNLEYALDILVASSEACTSDVDCALAPGRGLCEGGGCVPFVPDTPSPLGGICDSADDCADENAFCWQTEGGVDESFCTTGCFSNSDCSFFAGGRCLRLGGRFHGACFPGCEVESDCPAPYTCVADGGGGACEVVACGVDEDCGDSQACQRQDFDNQGFCRGFEEVVCEGTSADGNGQTSTATTVVPGVVEDLSICNDEADWFQITVEAAPAALVVSADFSGPADLDVYIYDAAGQTVGLGVDPEADPEVARAEYLAAGTYLIRVDQFGADGPDRLTPYDLQVTLTQMEAGCTQEGGECLGVSPMRILCAEASYCTFLDGDAAVEPGGLCDSDDDCSSASDLCFTFDGAQNGNNICTHVCGSEGECLDVPGSTCTQINRRTSICLPE